LSFRSRKKPSSNNNTATSSAPNNVPSTNASTATKNGGATTSEPKPLQWQDDEKSVRVGSCNYNVKVKDINPFCRQKRNGTGNYAF
jgi:hypothetical protein